MDAYSSHAVEDARSPNEQTNARFASNVAISSRGIAASLLVAKAYESNSQIDGFFRDIYDWDAHEPKDDSDAQVVQSVCYNLCACHRSHDVRREQGQRQPASSYRTDIVIRREALQHLAGDKNIHARIGEIMNTTKDDVIASWTAALGPCSCALIGYYHSFCATSRLGQLMGEVWIPLREEYGFCILFGRSSLSQRKWRLTLLFRTGAIVFIYRSGVDWAMGWNSIQYLINAEIFPLRVRSLGTSIVMCIHFVNQCGNSKVVPQMLLALKPVGTFFSLPRLPCLVYFGHGFSYQKRRGRVSKRWMPCFPCHGM